MSARKYFCIYVQHSLGDEERAEGAGRAGRVERVKRAKRVRRAKRAERAERAERSPVLQSTVDNNARKLREYI